MVRLYGEPISPVPSVKALTCSAGTIVSMAMLIAIDFGVDALPVSVPVRVIVVGPNGALGVPEMVQLVAPNVVPRPETAGVSVQAVRAPIPPIVLKVWLKGCPTSPVPGAKLRKVKAGLTIKVIVTEACCAGTLLSPTERPMVNCPLIVERGVPLIVQPSDVAISVSPGGKPFREPVGAEAALQL